MKIRKYLGKDTHEAILKVKMDLGNEAVIVNTRKVRQKGFFKMFAKPLVEVLAAVDENAAIETHRVQKVAYESMGQNKNQIKFNEKEGKMSLLENKINNIELILGKLSEQMRRSTEIKPEKRDVSQTHNILNLFNKNLLKNEVDEEISQEIMANVKQKIGVSTSVNDTVAALGNILSGMLGKPEPLKLREDGKPTVVVFVGPTGVGKTTTLAKIAANYLLNFNKKVGMITADTYRIAAVEQLRTYADILGIPVSVIYSAKEIKDAIVKHNDKDLILVDTAGRSSKDIAQFEELKSLINYSNADEIYLVLSTTTSSRNCKEILKNYSFLKNYKLIFTKLDETMVTGLILNARKITQKSISYITTGQSVPDDIEVMNVEKITKILLGRVSDK